MPEDHKYNSQRVAVVGGGIFGCLVSIELAGRGFTVNLYERNCDIMSGASLNNQNRLHLGYHYPRDDNTAIQCIKGFEEFKRLFPSCILEGFKNNYYISSRDSKVSLKRYIQFCERVGLPVSPVSDDFPVSVRNVEGGISTDEVVYDSLLLAAEIRILLRRANVTVLCDHDISKVNKGRTGCYSLTVGDRKVGEFDKVINCTYANYNKFNKDLGLKDRLLQYEYTLVPIIRWREDAVGITVMDGSFMTILPFGTSGKFLLYHVDHAVIASEVKHCLNQEWLTKSSSPSRFINKEEHFNIMLEACTEFVPALSSAQLVGFLEGPRVVFYNRDATDERPSVISLLDGDGFFSVFSGKIDHSIWVAKDVADIISSGEVL